MPPAGLGVSFFFFFLVYSVSTENKTPAPPCTLCSSEKEWHYRYYSRNSFLRLTDKMCAIYTIRCIPLNTRCEIQGLEVNKQNQKLKYFTAEFTCERKAT